MKSKEPKEPREKKAKARKRSEDTKLAARKNGEVEPLQQHAGDCAPGHSGNGAVTHDNGVPASGNGEIRLSEDLIRVRAYELFIARGGEHGHHLDDWLAAERELKMRPPA